ncbi:MAG: metallophosphoesterase [Alphaproteobacteria bacterium]|nr:metallophosphoesterase [Alphaproteobacteria bacterium]
MTDNYWTNLLFGGDLHKRHKDITTIEGYVNCTHLVQKALMQLVVERDVDYFTHLGDWFDKGYASDIAAALVDYDMDLQFSKKLNGNFYGLIGNHIRLSMDSNPELHLIQPHAYLKSRKKTTRKEQIIRTPNMLRINDVQISFQHFDMGYDDVKQYKPKRESWAKYHIALFHTPLIVPNAQLVNTAYGYNVSTNSDIAYTLENVDLAICGDIHKPLGQFDINKPDGSKTIMIVPGSLTNTDAGDENRHSSILLPFIQIGKESEVKIQYIPFDLKTNNVTFKKKNLELSKEKMKSLRGKSIEHLNDPTDVVAALSSRDDTLMSLNAFMTSKGYTLKDKQLVKSVIQQPDDLKSIMQIWVSD